MTFPTTFIWIIKLYNSIIMRFSILDENINKKLFFFSIFYVIFPNLSNFSLFQKNYDNIFQFYTKRAFIWYKNISSSITFSQHHERIQIFKFFQKIMIFQHFLQIFEKKATSPKRHPKFYWIFKVLIIKNVVRWGDVVRREYSPPTWWETDYNVSLG